MARVSSLSPTGRVLVLYVFLKQSLLVLSGLVSGIWISSFPLLIWFLSFRFGGGSRFCIVSSTFCIETWDFWFSAASFPKFFCSPSFSKLDAYCFFFIFSPALITTTADCSNPLQNLQSSRVTQTSKTELMWSLQISFHDPSKPPSYT